MTTEKFEQWCVVGLFGHQKLSGLVSEYTIGGAGFLRVEFPETTHNPAFTRIINPSSVYDINPETEDVAKAYSENLHVKPIESWNINEFMKKVEQKRLAESVSRNLEYEEGSRQAEEDLMEPHEFNPDDED